MAMHDAVYSCLGDATGSSVSVSVSDTIANIGELHSPSKDWHKPSVSRYNACKISLPGLLEGPLEEIANSICGVRLEDSWDGNWSVANSKTKKGHKITSCFSHAVGAGQGRAHFEVPRKFVPANLHQPFDLPASTVRMFGFERAGAEAFAIVVGNG